MNTKKIFSGILFFTLGLHCIYAQVPAGTASTATSSNGDVTYYDASGNKIGSSSTSSYNGDVSYYDSSGNKTGSSSTSSYNGDVTYYDSSGNKTGSSSGR
jgi:general stress protein YciG